MPMTPTQFKHFLQQWDEASKSNRGEMLNAFIKEHNGKTGPELELVLSNSASLFFTRLTAWLRLSYATGAYLKSQLKCILVFAGASNGFKFLTEFIEVGGILTLLEILALPKVNESNKVEALELLTVISSTGRKYKELICESFGVRALCECVAKSRTLVCQEACHTVLIELSTGNPKYLQQIYKSMILLLKSASSEAQKMAAQLLQFLQPMVDSPSISIIDSTLTLLRSLHVEVQYEGCLLTKQLLSYGNIKLDIVQGLVALLQPSKIDMSDKPEHVAEGEEANTLRIQPPLPAFIQQACAAKLIRNLAREDKELTDLFLKMECITKLLFAMSNEKHGDSQKQAGLTLQHFIHEYPEVESRVRDAMGQTFFFEYMNSPDEFYLNLTTMQLQTLSTNKVAI